MHGIYIKMDIVCGSGLIIIIIIISHSACIVLVLLNFFPDTLPVQKSFEGSSLAPFPTRLIFQNKCGSMSLSIRPTLLYPFLYLSLNFL